MSIVTTLPATESSLAELRRSGGVFFGALVSALLTPLSLLVLGFHPYAEDGGLYLAGVKYVLNPSLFPHMRQFVTAPLHYSAFAPCTAFLIRNSGLSFDTVVFGFFLVCLWATIFAAWSIAEACFGSFQERIGATLLVALWISLPVAGTSLMLIDPYLTARSLSTPLVLFAIANALNAETTWKRAGAREAWSSLGCAALWLLFAGMFHPLMAGYGATLVIAILWIGAPRPRSKSVKTASLLLAGLLLAAAVQTHSPMPSAAITRVSLTRSYWFLAQWEWFEVLGLVAPLLILVATFRSRSFRRFRPAAISAITIGITAMAISVCFARTSLHSFGVAHLQPLRVFQVIYFLLFLAVGAWLARIVLRDVWWRWGIALLLLSAPVMIPAWLIFPHSAHIELPQSNPLERGPNQWVEAFRWIKRNTPVDALVALDADYISDPGEDAQGFRAIAERSMLPDYSKDGGETAVNPSLSEAWTVGVDAQQGLSRQDDTARLRTLRALGVTWIVLQSRAQTLSRCPYDNGTVKVCELNAISAAPV